MTSFESEIVEKAEAHRKTSWAGRKAFLARVGLAYDDAAGRFARGRFVVPAEFVLFEPPDSWNEMLKQMHRGASEFAPASQDARTERG